MRAQRNNALIQFVDNIKEADGVWHQEYWRHNRKTKEPEFVRKDKPFRFICRGETKTDIHNHQQHFPEHCGKGFKIISVGRGCGEYPTCYEIFEK